MLAALAQRWWILLLRGCVAILFGILAITNPGGTLWTLVLLWGAFVIVDGIVSLAFGVAGGTRERSWWEMLLGGAISLGAGAAALLWPGITAMALLFVIAAWSIVWGVLEIMAAIRLRREMEGEWLLVVAGLLAIALGALLLMRPAQGTMAFMFLIGAYAVIIGILRVALSLRLYGYLHRLTEARAA